MLLFLHHTIQNQGQLLSKMAGLYICILLNNGKIQMLVQTQLINSSTKFEQEFQRRTPQTLENGKPQEGIKIMWDLSCV